DLTRDLATDLDGDDGVEVARGGHGGGEGPALALGQAVLRGAIPALRVQVTPDPRAEQQDDNDNGDEAFHRLLDGREPPDIWRLPAADRAVQPGESDAVVRQGLGLRVLG